jgi:hypothetical protein
MEYKKARFTLLLVLGLSQVGCSEDPKVASVANFETVLRAHHATTPTTCYHKFFEDFPLVIKTLSDSKKNPNNGNPPELLGQLVKSGLLTQVEKESTVVSRSPAYGPDGLVQKTFAFDLTAEGSKWYVRAKVENGSRKSDGGFCFGKEKVVKVEQFTEPADMFGMRISKVSYLLEIEEIPAWAKTEEIQKVMPQLRPAVLSSTQPIKKMGSLTLTNIGWVVAK